MWYVGLDAHLRQSSICVLDESGRLVRQQTVHGAWDDAVKAITSLKEPFSVCYEASCGYGYLHERLSRIAARVVVAHPGQLRLIFRSKRKNDRVDAQKLAKLLFLGEVPAVHVPSLDVRSWRGLIEHRGRLIVKRTRVKNSLRALLRTHGMVRRGLWSQKGMAWLRSVELQTESDRLRRDLLLEELSEMAAKVHRVDEALERIGARQPGVTLLRGIPGVGQRTAEAFAAYVDNPQRFGHSKCIGSYLGLIPRQDSSASMNRLGHITRDGPATVRHLLCEAAWQGVRRSAHIRSYYERILQHNPERKKIALVATAHYLARVMLAMLKTGEAWRHDGPVQTAAA